MMNLELPHVNVFSKVDLLDDKSQLEPYLIPDHETLAGELHERMRPKYRKLNSQIAQLLDDYSMVSFHPLDISDEDSLAFILYTVDSAVQYGEDADVRASRDVELNGGEFDDTDGMISAGMDGLGLVDGGMEHVD
jgi:hypothetical protein